MVEKYVSWYLSLRTNLQYMAYTALKGHMFWSLLFATGHYLVDRIKSTQVKYHLPEEKMVGHQCSWPKYPIIPRELLALITDTCYVASFMYHGLLRYMMIWLYFCCILTQCRYSTISDDLQTCFMQCANVWVCKGECVGRAGTVLTCFNTFTYPQIANEPQVKFRITKQCTTDTKTTG